MNLSASILVHCTFPNARKVEHLMDATITIEPGARYSYFERHVHEAAIGSVDSKQLQTLLTRGLLEEEATDIII